MSDWGLLGVWGQEETNLRETLNPRASLPRHTMGSLACSIVPALPVFCTQFFQSVFPSVCDTVIVGILSGTTLSHFQLVSMYTHIYLHLPALIGSLLGKQSGKPPSLIAHSVFQTEEVSF